MSIEKICNCALDLTRRFKSRANTVEVMRKSMAWDPASVRPEARRIAEEAARREGMSLLEWLDAAIVGSASSTATKEEDEEFRLQAADGRSRSWLNENLVRRQLRHMLHNEEVRARETEVLLESAIARIDRRIRRGEERLNRAIGTISDLLDRTGEADRETLSMEPSGRIAADDPGLASPLFASRQAAALHRDAKERSDEILQKGDAARQLADEPKSSESQVTETRRFDLKAAISQIALRRQALDAQEARKALGGSQSPHASDGAPSSRQVCHASAVTGPSDGSQTRLHVEAELHGLANRVDEARVEHHESPSPSTEVRHDDIQTLAKKLDVSWRERVEQRRCAAELKAIREGIDAMIRSLAELAPHNATVALEGAIRDLTERVALLGQDGERKTLLAPLEATAAELRAALKTYHPQKVVTGLEREISGLARRIDALAETAIRPESLERIQRQTEEVRNLLAAAAMRTAPVERLERQIGELAERIEKLSASPAPYAESAQMAASLVDVRKEIERSTPVSALALIEHRLEQIAERLDSEMARHSQGHADHDALEDLARRIDGVRASLEAQPQPKIDITGLDATLKELSTRLECSNAEPLKALIQDINEKLDAGSPSKTESDSIELMLAEIIDKLDRLLGAEESVKNPEPRSTERSPQPVAVQQDVGWALGSEFVSQIAEGVARRLEGDVTLRIEAQALAEKVTRIHDRLEALSGLDSLQGVLHGLATILAASRGERSNKHGDVPRSFPGRMGPIESQTSVVQKTEALNTQDSSGSDAVGTLFKPVMPPTDRDSALSRSAGEDILLEPGTGAPQPAREARELSQETSSRTNASISAHIAAARRASHSAPSEAGLASAPFGALSAVRGVERARSLYANRKRSVLLAVGLALVVAAAAGLIRSYTPFAQKVESNGQPVKSAAMGGSSSNQVEPSVFPAPDMRPVDTTPTASIATAPGGPKIGPQTGAPPPELAAALPAQLRDAIAAGSPGAQYELAQRFFEGRGLPQDQLAAAFWLEQAASAGLAPAQFRLGTLYQKGIGVTRDPATAKRWYTKAAQAGNARAAHNLAVMFAEPAGEKPDYAEAAKWFRKAGELGVRDSQFNLGVLYARGLGVDQDLRQSWLWFSLAAAQGDVDAAKKRDEVAAKMDPSALSAAADELAKFRIGNPDPGANEVASPPGGWDGKPGVSPLGQTLPAPFGEARLRWAL